MNGIKTKNIGTKLNIEPKVALRIMVFLRKATACAVRVEWYQNKGNGTELNIEATVILSITVILRRVTAREVRVGWC